jgi:imidazolonepropionase-like amidohydrolase
MLPRHGLLLAALALACSRAPQPSPPQAPEAPAPTPIAADLAIVGARVFDGTSTSEGVTVLVADGRIVAVGPDVAPPSGVQTVDASGMTLLPGLVDAHAHVHGPLHLQQAAVFGVTTELDMMGDPVFAGWRRKEQQAGRADDAADMLGAGHPVTVEGGHGTEYGMPIPTVSDPAELDAWVQARVQEGSDYIKIVYDHGSAGHSLPTLDEPLLRAAVTAAHAHDRMAIVHIGSIGEARDAIEAGADGLAHLWLHGEPDAEIGALAAKRGVFVTDTLAVLFSACDGNRGAALAEDPRFAEYVTPQMRRELHATFPIPADRRPKCSVALEGARAMHAAGVPLLASTDAPNPGTAHGISMHDELALLVEAGLRPEEALAAATSGPAARFGLDDRGRIAVGARADLLLVRGDPTRDITATRDIVAVWKAGHAIDRDAWKTRVEEARAAVEAARRVAPPEGSEDGLVSDFEAGDLSTRFGAGLSVSTDAMIGGASKAELHVVSRGAHRSRRALSIRGEVVESRATSTWAGVFFVPGSAPGSPANLSAKSTLAFSARGEPGTYVAMLLSRSRGPMPAFVAFEVGEAWSTHSLALADFRGIEPYEITGIFIGRGDPGAFELVLDDVRLD